MKKLLTTITLSLTLLFTSIVPVFATGDNLNSNQTLDMAILNSTNSSFDIYESEPNDIRDEANKIQLNKKIHGEINGRWEDDYYEIVLTKNENLTIIGSMVPNPHIQSDLTNDFLLYLSNSDTEDIGCSELKIDDVTGVLTQELRINVNAGTYYIDACQTVSCVGEKYVFTVNGTKAIKVSKVSLNKKTTSLNLGDFETLIPTISPSNATNQNATWKSSNIAIATVSSYGVVTGVKAGASTITVTTVDGKKTSTCKVTVKNTPSINIFESEPNNEESQANIIQLDKIVHGNIDEEFDLDYYKIIIPKNGNLSIKGSMNNVNEYGSENQDLCIDLEDSNFDPIGYSLPIRVNGKAIAQELKFVAESGTYYIVVSQDSFDLSDTKYTFTTDLVSPSDLVSLKVSKPSLSMDKGASASLSLTATFKNRTTKDVSEDATWVSSEEDVATIDIVDGIAMIDAIAKGSTVITGEYFGKKVTAKVTVK